MWGPLVWGKGLSRPWKLTVAQGLSSQRGSHTCGQGSGQAHLGYQAKGKVANCPETANVKQASFPPRCTAFILSRGGTR